MYKGYVGNIFKTERVSRSFDGYTNFWVYLYLLCSFTILKNGGLFL